MTSALVNGRIFTGDEWLEDHALIINGDRMGHRGLHPDAEDVELEQAEVLDVVLVELAHREAGP